MRASFQERAGRRLYLSTETIEAVVLAAGRSRRMGVPKLLLPLRSGETILQHLVGSLLEVPIRRVLVVLGHRANLIGEEIDRVFPGEQKQERVTTLLNPEYRRGLAGSLRRGIQALRSSTTGALLVVGDQPLVGGDRLRDLVSKFRHRPEGIAATAASSGEGLRNPVVVDETFFDAILDLEGDRGAQPLLRKRRDEVDPLVWGEGPWFQDVDTWPLYERLIRRGGDVPESGEDPTEVSPARLPDNWRQALEEKRSHTPPPVLAPGVLLLDLGRRRLGGWEHLPLPIRFPASRPARDGAPQVEHVIAGPGRSGEEYVRLLRTAAVWCLNNR